MKIDKRVVERLKALVSEGEKLLNESSSGETEYDVFVNPVIAYEWKIKSINALEDIFGKERRYLTEFESCSNDFGNLGYGVRIEEVWQCVGIVKGATSDYKNGYSFKIVNLIQAEIFDNFSEQAEHLLQKNYYGAAAVIAGCVLEDSLRKLGQRKIPNFPTDKTIDPMNVELAKAGIYNALWQKKITALADLRNKAAHGKWTEFNEKDVEDMIRDVRRFMEDYFS